MTLVLDQPQTADPLERAIHGLLALVFLMVETPVAIITAHAGEQGGRVLMTNPAFDRKLGTPPGQLAGRLALRCVSAVDRPRVADAIARQDETLRGFTMEIALVDASGVDIPTVLTCVLPSAPELRRFRIITLPATAPRALPDQVAAGKIRLISLADIRDLLGDEWDAVAARVLALARRAIEDHLGPQDTVRATSDLGFVMVFTGASEIEASARATSISRAIRRALIRAGEDAASEEVASTVIQISAPATEAALDCGFAAIESPLARRHVTAPGCAFERVQGCGRGEFVGWLVAYAGIPGVDGAIPGLAPRLMDRLAHVLKAAARQASHADSRQSREHLFLEVGLAAFASRVDADALMDALACLDPAARARLVLLLSGIPPGVPNSRLADIAVRLAPHCHATGFALTELDPPAFDLALFRSPVVAVDASSWGDTPPEARIARLVQSVHLKRARLLVRRAASLTAARQLRALGVDLVSCAPPIPS